MKNLSRRRRARGIGSIKEVTAGQKYIVTYELPRVGTLGARLQRRETYFGARKGADQILRDRLNEVRSGAYPDEDRLTFDGLADRYLIAKALSKEPTTIAWYKRHLVQHIRPVLGDMQLRSIRAHHIQSLLSNARNGSRTKRRGESLNATSLRNILVAIRAILAWGVKQGHLARNVADNVETPSIPYVERAVIDLGTLKALLATTAGTELDAIVATAVGTGLRRSELCALHWGDLDFDVGTIRVRRAAANVDGKVIIKAPKTKRSQRIDHLPAFVLAVLRRHRSAQAERHLALGIGNRGADGMVFDRLDGRLWDPNELSRQFSRLIRREKLPAFRFHDLRHGYATLAFAAGVPLKTVSESLGHSAIGVTDAIYVHLRDEAKREKADRLDAYLDAAVGILKDVPPGHSDALVTSGATDAVQSLTA